ncbi:MAG: SWIM zinc finger domain-containing protein [Bacillota bacterium]|nr:SWIM zinc finger domain-containing protein [Bacillota bacterium]
MRPAAVDEARLVELAGVRALEAAWDYWMLGRVQARVRWRDRLAGRVDGYRDRYRVRARPSAEGVESACSCGRRQPCRHAAALLLAWSREPESFADLEALAAPWEEAPAEELADLFWRFLQAPDEPLEAFVEAGRSRAWERQPPEGRLRHLEGFLGERPEEAPARFDELAASLAPRAGEGEEVRLRRLELEGELLGRFLDLPGELRARLGLERWGRLAERWLGELEAGATPAPSSAFPLLARALAEPDLPPGLYARLLRAAVRLDPRGVVEELLRAASARAEAERRLGRAGAEEERERSALALADLLALRGRGEEAARVLEEAAGLPAVGERRIEGCLARGDLRGAVDAARGSLAAADGAAVRYWRARLADLLEASGEAGEALALRVSNFAEGADLASYRRLREAALRLGRWPEVAGAARAALLRQEGRAALLAALLEEGEAAALAEELPAALADPAVPFDLALRAVLWLGRRDPRRARALGEALLLTERGDAHQRARLRRALSRMRLPAAGEPS